MSFFLLDSFKFGFILVSQEEIEFYLQSMNTFEMRETGSFFLGMQDKYLTYIDVSKISFFLIHDLVST